VDRDRGDAVGAVAARRELAAGWPAILACFVTAILGWGFGFYGQAVYLAELQHSRGWSGSLISSGTTLYYLVGAGLIALTPGAIARFGARTVVISGAAIMVGSALGIALAAAPWQLYLADLAMAVGWAATSSATVTTTLALWFERRRGLAISLALNGASAAGFTVAPALVYLSARHGLPTAIGIVAAALLLVLVPLAGIALRPRRGDLVAALAATPAARSGTSFERRGEALRSLHFWSLAAPFALALMAQVGFIVHQVAFLLPRLGNSGTGLAVAATTVAALVGRVGLGFVIDRLPQRRVTAIALASQALALLAMMLWPEQAAILYAGSIVFGLSVGNLITLPALIVQREFAASSFGLVIGLSTAIAQFTYAFGPTLLAAVHDASGGYGAALAVCIVLEIAAGAIVMMGGRREVAAS